MTEHATLADALDELARAAADAPDTRWSLTVLAAAVTGLEHALDADLGPADHDPLVVLQRRLGRVHRLALADAGGLAAEQVRAHRAALDRPRPAPVAPSTVAGGRPVPAGVPC